MVRCKAGPLSLPRFIFPLRNMNSDIVEHAATRVVSTAPSDSMLFEYGLQTKLCFSLANSEDAANRCHPSLKLAALIFPLLVRDIQEKQQAVCPFGSLLKQNDHQDDSLSFLCTDSACSFHIYVFAPRTPTGMNSLSPSLFVVLRVACLSAEGSWVRPSI
jgi:hypothetical protein